MARHARDAGALGSMKAETPQAFGNAAEKAAAPVEKALYAALQAVTQGREGKGREHGRAIPALRFFDISRQPHGLDQYRVKKVY